MKTSNVLLLVGGIGVAAVAAYFFLFRKSPAPTTGGGTTVVVHDTPAGGGATTGKSDEQVIGDTIVGLAGAIGSGLASYWQTHPAKDSTQGTKDRANTTTSNLP